MFLLGAPRSGTSLLYKCLALNPGAAWVSNWVERFRRSSYFRLSIVRATVRWLKHMVSFEGWLDYIVQKASRHGGEELRLSERERRFPLLLLWGRVFRYLASSRKGARKKE